jgi:hypothetical protein
MKLNTISSIALVVLLPLILAGHDRPEDSHSEREAQGRGSEDARALKTEIVDNFLIVEIPDKTKLTRLMVFLATGKQKEGLGEGTEVPRDKYELVDKKVSKGEIYASKVAINLDDVEKVPDVFYVYRLKAEPAFEERSSLFKYSLDDKKFRVVSKDNKGGTRAWTRVVFWVLVGVVVLLIVGVLVKVCT